MAAKTFSKARSTTTMETSATGRVPRPEEVATIQVSLSVPDVKQAVDLYTKLGCTTQFSIPGPGGLTFAMLQLGNSLIQVNGVDGQHVDPKRQRDIKKGPRGLGVNLYVTVPDVDAVHKALVKNKVEVLQRPKEEFWGDKVAICLDPFGYEWSFAQHLRDVDPDELAKSSQRAAAERN